MKILVLIKQVPNTTEIKIDPKTGTLNRQGAVSIMNPDDKAALELAIRLKEAQGGEISIISMGPPQAKKVIFEAIAMGADNGYLLSDFAFAGADTLATSSALYGLIKTLSYDIIIGGRQAIDGDTAQVGPELAEKLGLPQVSYVTDLKYEHGQFELIRTIEDRYQVLRAKGPLLVTVSGGTITPRYLNCNLLLKADKEIDSLIKVLGAKDLDVNLADLGLKGSPTQVRKTMSRELNVKEPPVELAPQEAVALIISKLKEKHII